MSAWIEVKEGCNLPKNGHDVLIWYKNGMELGYHFSVLSPIDGWYFHGNRVDGVTHWMPLPDRPEGK